MEYKRHACFTRIWEWSGCAVDESASRISFRTQCFDVRDAWLVFGFLTNSSSDSAVLLCPDPLCPYPASVVPFSSRAPSLLLRHSLICAALVRLQYPLTRILCIFALIGTSRIFSARGNFWKLPPFYVFLPLFHTDFHTNLNLVYYTDPPIEVANSCWKIIYNFAT